MQRDTKAFAVIDAATFAAVELSVADERSLSVTCDENLLDLIETSVTDGVLHIEDRHGHSLSSSQRCLVEVAAPRVEQIRSAGSGSFTALDPLSCLEYASNVGSGAMDLSATLGCGDIELDNAGSGGLSVGQVIAEALSVHNVGSGGVDLSDVQAASVDVRSTGSGGMTLAGGADVLDLESMGSGSVLATDLIASSVFVDSLGSGRAVVHAADEVSAVLAGSGDVEVWGDPAVRSVSESGSGQVIFH